jgi:hypothetical protein
MPTASRRSRTSGRASSASSKKRRPTPHRHRVDEYAAAVIAGRIVAGPWVRLACERHRRDRATADEHGFVFDEGAADHAIGFFENFLRLPDTADEDGNPKPFLLQPWQVFIIGSLFGWKWKVTGYRRYRNAYIEIGKGNGKTPLCAGIGLYGLTMDGEAGARDLRGRGDRDQAQIMFRDAVRMVDCSPELSTASRSRASSRSTTWRSAWGSSGPSRASRARSPARGRTWDSSTSSTSIPARRSSTRCAPARRAGRRRSSSRSRTAATTGRASAFSTTSIRSASCSKPSPTSAGSRMSAPSTRATTR